MNEVSAGLAGSIEKGQPLRYVREVPQSRMTTKFDG